MLIKYSLKRFLLLLIFLSVKINLYAQCFVIVDTTNITHIPCPNGTASGSAQIVQAQYLNYSWYNVSNGQIYGNGPNVTYLQNLDAGLYVITASSPYSSSCPDTIYSDTFEVRRPIANVEFFPTQPCPNECNVTVNMVLTDQIPSLMYTYSIDGLSSIPIIDEFYNICGGAHTYELSVDGVSCGVENFAISQFAPLILSTSTTNASCTQNGSATVTIAGVGASALNNYCESSPQYPDYSIIEQVILNGDNSIINNNTSNICSKYSDYTSISADITPGNTYSLNLGLGTCHIGGFSLIDVANIYIDWNIDGDFDDSNELISNILPTQSPSTHLINFSVPINAIPGETRMRIVMQNAQYQPANNAEPCSDSIAWFGETEDYRLIINGSIPTPIVYSWSNGQTSSTATNLSSGVYIVTITDANGCNSYDTVSITGSSNISVSATFDQTICNGYAPSSLNASSGGVSGTYSWVNASNPSVILGTGSNFSPPPLTSTTTYTVTFTEAVTGCTASDDVVITVVPLITPTFNQIAPICAGGSFTLPIISTNGISGSWSPAPNFITTTTYTFSPTGTSTCVTNTTITVVINPIPTVTLTANPNPACIGNNILLTANPSFAGLYRFQYNSGGSWINFTNPGWSSLSTQTFSNIQNTTDFRVRAMEDFGCNTGPWSPVVTVPISNIITQPINHN